MTNNEKKLFLSLCDPINGKIDEKLIKYATPTVLGMLFMNRMQGVAHYVLEKNGLLQKVTREFRNSLTSAREQNVSKNESFYRCVRYLSRILDSTQCNYAMLKGAELCRYYPKGTRTSCDIDILVLPECVTKIGNVLVDSGFIQGAVHNGELVPATRKEIIESKMLRGETVPYVKQVDFPSMKFLEVDLNFSLDYKNGNADIEKQLLIRSKKKVYDGTSISGLAFSDFFIHLCAHLYKEATTLPWIEMKRDMTLYKYCDIHMLLSEMSLDDTKGMFERAKELYMDKICAFAILHTFGLFDIDNDYAVSFSKMLLNDDPDFLHKVISPKNNKALIYTNKNIKDRFFSAKRIDLLVEDKPHENDRNA